MASLGLLGAVGGLGEGMSQFAEDWREDTRFEKRRQAKIDDAEAVARLKQNLELDALTDPRAIEAAQRKQDSALELYRQKKGIDQEYARPEAPDVQDFGPRGRGYIDPESGKVVIIPGTAEPASGDYDTIEGQDGRLYVLDQNTGAISPATRRTTQGEQQQAAGILGEQMPAGDAYMPGVEPSVPRRTQIRASDNKGGWDFDQVEKQAARLAAKGLGLDADNFANFDQDTQRRFAEITALTVEEYRKNPNAGLNAAYRKVVQSAGQKDDLLEQARDAIKQGADPEAVKKRLRDQYGITDLRGL